MPKRSFHDLVAFVAVAQERSFTRAAAKLGVSQSALSHTIRGLEERLACACLTRTTRSVAPTEAGERLLARRSAPRFEEIDAELAALSELRDKPAGTIRITAGEHAAERDPVAGRSRKLLPRLSRHQGRDHRRLGPDRHRRRALRRRRPPRRTGGQGHDRRAHRPGHAHGRRRRALLFRARARKPKTPQDLTEHNCINLRLPTYGGLYAWEFEKGGRELKVRVEGQLVFNTIDLRLKAALAGLGLACLPEEQVSGQLASGELVRVLADWCPPFSGYHLYYPSRRQPTPGLRVLVEALRYRG